MPATLRLAVVEGDTDKAITATVAAGNPYLKGRHSTVDLLVSTSLDRLFLYLKICVSFL
jgi:hypothetical protein